MALVAMPTEVTVAEKLRAPAKKNEGNSVGKEAMGPGWNRSCVPAVGPSRE